jgi:hypothetical protein
MAKDGNAECHADAEADDAWTLVRREGAWRPEVFQDGGWFCWPRSEIRIALPKTLVGTDRLAISWRTLSQAMPDLQDAVSSPDATWTLLLTPSALVFVPRSDVAHRTRLSSVPKAKIVMAEWAIGTHVGEWSKVLADVR